MLFALFLFASTTFAQPPRHCGNLSALIANNSQYGADGVFNESHFPDAFKDLVPLHIPHTFLDGVEGFVQMDFHPQTPEHYITDMWLLDERHRLIECRTFNSSAHTDMHFRVPTHTGLLHVYEHCNLHGVWEAKTIELRCSDIRRYVDENEKRFNTSGIFNATHYPAAFADLATLHVPTVKFGSNFTSGMVTLPGHPMTDEHHITDMWVVDERGRQLACDRLHANQTAELQFYIEEHVREIRVLEHCNLHGLWETARLNVTALREESL